MQHSPTCASGARAELRGECDCGAVDDRPYRARFTDTHDDTGRRLIELQLDRPLTCREAGELEIVLQTMTREEGQRWARHDMRTNPVYRRADDAAPPPWEVDDES